MSETTFKNEPKSIDIKSRVFMANGNKYYIAEKISIDRWKQYEKLVPRLTFGVDFKELFANILKAYNFLNQPKPEPLSAGIILYNIMEGIKNAEDAERVPPGLIMCALVMNREGENVGVYDEQLALEKINDWRAEGLDILSFFAWALNSINGFRETYLLFIQGQINHLTEKTNLMKPVD